MIDLDQKNRLSILEQHIKNGVIIPCTDGVIIDENSTIKAGTVILPGTIIINSTIEDNCKLGPNSYIENTKVEKNVIFKASFADESFIGEGTKIGPYCNLRPNTVLGKNVKLGDFVEVKNSNLGNNTSASHLTYIGDSDVGSGVNFGCGTVTVNYDGKSKARTIVGNNVFIGCNSNLIAPVTVADNSYIAAGSTIVENIPEYALAIARSRQTIKENWVIENDRKK